MVDLNTLPLAAVFETYRDLSARFAECDDAGVDVMLAELEHQLQHRAVTSAEDLLAKAAYLRSCAAIDGGQITAAAVDTLIQGIAAFVPGILPAPQLRAA